jgi:hypothetical protein
VYPFSLSLMKHTIDTYFFLIFLFFFLTFSKLFFTLSHHHSEECTTFFPKLRIHRFHFNGRWFTLQHSWLASSWDCLEICGLYMAKITIKISKARKKIIPILFSLHLALKKARIFAWISRKHCWGSWTNTNAIETERSMAGLDRSDGEKSWKFSSNFFLFVEWNSTKKFGWIKKLRWQITGWSYIWNGRLEISGCATWMLDIPDKCVVYVSDVDNLETLGCKSILREHSKSSARNSDTLHDNSRNRLI